ncbi:MAG: glycosyltransferase family 2 protein [Candidatus Omnitrophota bacterium]
MIDARKVKVSIVVPALNEERTIADFIGWCKEGLARAGVEGQILIVDSSTDRTADIVRSLGAEVLTVPKRGLGRAYLDAIPHIRGDYVIMGDADCTYDFRRLEGFIAKLDEGCDAVGVIFLRRCRERVDGRSLGSQSRFDYLL